MTAKKYGKVRGCMLQPPCHSTCPKCGSDDIYRKYVPDGSQVSSTSDVVPAADDVFFRNSVYGRKLALKECLVNHCRTCGYCWSSNTLDHDKETQHEVQTVLQDP